MPLVDAAGSIGGVDPVQIAAIALKVGVILGLTVTFSVAVVAHCPAVGVKV
jgi:hypothetical protein